MPDWSHQDKTIALLFDSLRRGNKRIVVVQPTGGGKTRTSARVIKSHLVGPNRKALLVAHRTELIEQAYDTYTSLGLNCGIIKAGVDGNRCNPHRPVQIASIDTLLSRGFPEGITLIIIDECHHYISDTYATLLSQYPNAFIIGLTATPVRGDERGLGEQFQDLVVGATIKELVRAGVLVPCEVLAPKRPLGPKRVAQRPVDAYLEHAKGRKTVVFAPNSKAAQEYVEQFTAAGITCAFVHHKSSDRAQILAGFKAGKIQVLVNQSLLTEGWDDPETSCCILARPCTSIGLFLQIVGRILRCAPGKVSALLLDLVGISRVHMPNGIEDTELEYSLDGEPIKAKGSRTAAGVCGVCGAPISPGAQICEDCGIERPGMVIPEITNDPLVKFGWVRRNHDEDKRKSNYFRWARDLADRGKDPHAVYYKYRHVYGEDPPWAWKFSDEFKHIQKGIKREEQEDLGLYPSQ